MTATRHTHFVGSVLVGALEGVGGVGHVTAGNKRPAAVERSQDVRSVTLCSQILKLVVWRLERVRSLFMF